MALPVTEFSSLMQTESIGKVCNILAEKLRAGIVAAPEDGVKFAQALKARSKCTVVCAGYFYARAIYLLATLGVFNDSNAYAVENELRHVCNFWLSCLTLVCIYEGIHLREKLFNVHLSSEASLYFEAFGEIVFDDVMKPKLITTSEFPSLFDNGPIAHLFLMRGTRNNIYVIMDHGFTVTNSCKFAAADFIMLVSQEILDNPAVKKTPTVISTEDDSDGTCPDLVKNPGLYTSLLNVVCTSEHGPYMPPMKYDSTEFRVALDSVSKIGELAAAALPTVKIKL